MNNYLLVAAALLPSIVLCIYVYIKDRHEKEPVGLLLLLLLAGAVCCFPAALIEEMLLKITDLFFGVHDAEKDTLEMARHVFYAYNFLKYFIGVALVEEFFKWISMVAITKKNKNFNSFFDGIIYAVFVSLGFAALENVLYVINGGWYVALIRAVMSVPGHMFDAVIMGYYYSLWHIYDKAAKLENYLESEGKISRILPSFPSKACKICSLLIPVAVHGFYDFCCAMGNVWGLILLIALVIFLYVHCFKKIRRMSVMDMGDFTYAKMLVINKYRDSVLAEADAQENNEKAVATN